MKISRVPDLVRAAYAANLPVLLSGRHGVGKSTVFEQVASELGLACCVLDLSLMEPVDLLGLPQIKDGRVTYAPPAALPVRGRGLLLLEELNRASAMTRTPALELLTRRRLHEYQLPDGWLPCASINPAGNGYAVDVLDPALVSRFIMVDVEADREDWLQWARTRGLHSGLLDYVDAAPDLFDSEKVNPRSLEFASRLLTSMNATRENVAECLEILTPGLSGLLGEVVATGILRFIAEPNAPFMPREILESYEAVGPTVQQWRRQGRLDLIQATLKRLQHALQQQKAWEAARADAKQAANLARFQNDLPPDLRKAFDAWIADRGYTRPGRSRR